MARPTIKTPKFEIHNFIYLKVISAFVTFSLFKNLKLLLNNLINVYEFILALSFLKFNPYFKILPLPKKSFKLSKC